MPKSHFFLTLPLIAITASCSAGESQQPVAQVQPTAAEERPMDEVPVRKTLANGDRQYAYRNGCIVVLEAKRAVVKTEGAVCQSHHRDISLLYASGD
ncbi:hypothetical protein SAMN03159496_03431 [Rhizobium sp. NFR07]|uniref:hypothetical protein n=1 Tax=Rhizobium sp. NFR07 TaxID=1566262 RepID=UPI0008E007E0|nr:hypothetical protein [Rhizobium sp. NFR07]SFB39678.1 hypothetical protein SAMN03159496_03431 [Rhizobium sp. NFR07]